MTLTAALMAGACFADEASPENAGRPAADLAAAEAAEGVQGAEGTYAAYYDQMKSTVVSTLEQLSAMTDEQLQDIIDGTDKTSAAMAAGWKGVKDELGVFTGVSGQEVTEDGSTVSIRSVAEYDSVPDNTTVYVNYSFDFKKQVSSIDWDVRYPMSKLIAEAGLNTLLGLGTVFIVLVFLSLVIGNIHWIPDLIENRKKKELPVSAPAAPAPAPAVVEEPEEEPADDLELVAVIAAAIAASEEIPADGFTVRSIRKVNRRKWLGA